MRQPYLDPGEENHDGECRVEDHFPVAETLEVTVLIWVRQQLLEDGVDFDRAVDVEDDTADGHQDDDDVQNVPERLQIRQLQILYLFTHRQTTKVALRLLIVEAKVWFCSYSFIHSFLLIQAAKPIKQQEQGMT